MSPLTVFGAVLAVLVVIDVLAWLWGWTLGAGLLWFVYTMLLGAMLGVAWLIYLVLWARRRRRFAWHLLIIPTVGVVGLAVALADLPQKARWAYDEPRLTTAAKSVLADPRTEFHDNTDRRIGSQDVYATEKHGGVVTFSFLGGSSSVETLEYRPDGSRPASGSEVSSHHLSGSWWLVRTD